MSGSWTVSGVSAAIAPELTQHGGRQHSDRIHDDRDSQRFNHVSQRPGTTVNEIASTSHAAEETQ